VNDLKYKNGKWIEGKRKEFSLGNDLMIET